MKLVLKTLAEQGARYRAKYGRKLTVVIDAFDLLPKSEDGQKAFAALMEWAKQQADNGDVTAVFVSSEGLAAHLARRTFCIVCVLCYALFWSVLTWLWLYACRFERGSTDEDHRSP